MYRSKTEEHLNIKTRGKKNGGFYNKLVSIQNTLQNNF